MFGYWLEIEYKATPNIYEIYYFGRGHFYDDLYCFGFGLDTA